MSETTETQQQGSEQQTPPTVDATGTNGGEQQQQQPEKTFTQADLDRIVTERLAKERQKQETAVKRAQDEATRKAQESQGQFEQLYKDAQAKLDETAAKLRVAELSQLQRQAADQAGLPAGLAGRLQGETLDDLVADAKAILAALPKPTAPNLNNEPGAGGSPPNGGMSEPEKQDLAAILGVNPKYLRI